MLLVLGIVTIAVAIGVIGWKLKGRKQNLKGKIELLEGKVGKRFENYVQYDPEVRKYSFTGIVNRVEIKQIELKNGKKLADVAVVVEIYYLYGLGRVGVVEVPLLVKLTSGRYVAFANTDYGQMSEQDVLDWVGYLKKSDALGWEKGAVVEFSFALDPEEARATYEWKADSIGDYINVVKEYQSNSGVRGRMKLFVEKGVSPGILLPINVNILPRGHQPAAL